MDFSVIEVNTVDRLIFACEFNENPRIFMYDYDFNLIKTLTNVCTLEVARMVHDKVNDLLFVFCKCPEYEIRIIDIKTGKQIEYENESIKINDDFLDFRLDPSNPNLFGILKKKKLEVYEWWKVGSWNKEADQIEVKFNYNMSEFKLGDLSEEVGKEDLFSGFLWNKSNVFTVTTQEGYVGIVKVINFEKLQVIKLNNSIQAALLTRKYLILLENNM